MGQLLYTVRCRIDRPDQAAQWVSWMKDKHLAEVVQCGALKAELVLMDDASPTIAGQQCFEARYRFADRITYDAYINEHAPRLRAEGLALYPLELGFAYERTVGEMIDEKGD